jgi:DMSO/TMAO reductase YedYZ molybdopterin-dependent catalytic subunit
MSARWLGRGMPIGIAVLDSRLGTLSYKRARYWRDRVITMAGPSTIRRRLSLSLSICLASGLASSLTSGCQNTVSTEQLDRWHQEAVAENARLTQAHSADLSKHWKLVVQGEVEHPITLDWAEIERLSTHEVTTYNPFADDPKVISRFKGVSIKTLLDRAKVNLGVKKITVVAADAYYSTMPLERAITDQGLLAIMGNGQPIPRSKGGPLYAIFHNNPTNFNSHEGQAWAYYTTHIIVGTEPLRLKVGDQTLNRFDIEQLPTQTITTLVGYKIGWSAEPVTLTGVSLKAVLARQKLKLPAQSIVKVRRKAMTPNQPQKSVELTADLLNRCDVLLAYRWGPNAQNIPASKGGPLTLAYGKNCTSDAAKDLAWLPFVESISIEPVTVKP